MPTIEKRIEAKGFWYDSNDNCCVDYTSVVELIEEQREIDIEKACKVHCQCCPCYNAICGGADSDCRQYVYFRKAMEEQE